MAFAQAPAPSGSCLSVSAPYTRPGRNSQVCLLLRTDRGLTRAPRQRSGTMDDSLGRLLNVSLLAGSGAHRAYYDRSGSSVSELTADELAAGFPPRPALNLRFFGGRTIAHLAFAHHYLGGAAAWVPADIASIDAALAKAMSDNDLQSVIQQYYDAPISSRMLPSMVLPGSAQATVYKDQVEAMVARICRYGALDGADTGSTVINILLPRGVVLVDGFTAGFEPPPGQEAEYERRRPASRRAAPPTTPWPSTPSQATVFQSSISPGRTSRRPSTTSSTRPGPTPTWTMPSGPATAPA